MCPRSSREMCRKRGSRAQGAGCAQRWPPSLRPTGPCCPCGACQKPRVPLEQKQPESLPASRKCRAFVVSHPSQMSSGARSLALGIRHCSQFIVTEIGRVADMGNSPRQPLLPGMPSAFTLPQTKTSGPWRCSPGRLGGSPGGWHSTAKQAHPIALLAAPGPPMSLFACPCWGTAPSSAWTSSLPAGSTALQWSRQGRCMHQTRLAVHVEAWHHRLSVWGICLQAPMPSSHMA